MFLTTHNSIANVPLLEVIGVHFSHRAAGFQSLPGYVYIQGEFAVDCGSPEFAASIFVPQAIR